MEISGYLEYEIQANKDLLRTIFPYYVTDLLVIFCYRLGPILIQKINF